MEERGNYGYFENRACEYFPCHSAAAGRKSFNCLFCYCPLYTLGDQCGGNFTYTVAGIKDCSNCLLPHSEGGYDHIMRNFDRIVEITKKRETQELQSLR